MKVFVCEEWRMLRALHARWPYRRSHCRHDLHWLVSVHPRAGRCAGGRAHSIQSLPSRRRRPHGR
jgi:hypothetical protein